MYVYNLLKQICVINLCGKQSILRFALLLFGSFMSSSFTLNLHMFFYAKISQILYYFPSFLKIESTIHHSSYIFCMSFLLRFNWNEFRQNERVFGITARACCSWRWKSKLKKHTACCSLMNDRRTNVFAVCLTFVRSTYLELGPALTKLGIQDVICVLFIPETLPEQFSNSYKPRTLDQFRYEVWCNNRKYIDKWINYSIIAVRDHFRSIWYRIQFMNTTSQRV